MLKIEKAIVNGKLITPEEYIEGTVASCPNCEGSLEIKNGQKRIKHFYHISESSCTKKQIDLAIGLFPYKNARKILQTNKPDLRYRCDRCDSCRKPVKIPTPKCEWLDAGIGNGSVTNVKADNFIFRIIHKYKRGKVSDLESLGLKWYEVDYNAPENVIRGCRTLCEKCEKHEKYKKIAKEIVERDKNKAEHMFFYDTKLKPEMIDELSILLGIKKFHRNNVLFMLEKIDTVRSFGPSDLILERYELRNSLRNNILSRIEKMISEKQIERLDIIKTSKYPGKSVYEINDINYLKSLTDPKKNDVLRFFAIDALLEKGR